MAKIFDIHSDMLYDLWQSKLKGIENRFEEFHVNQLKDSAISGGVWTMYSPSDFELIPALKMALEQIDMSKLPGFKVVLGLEGLRNLENVEQIYSEFYKISNDKTKSFANRYSDFLTKIKDVEYNFVGDKFYEKYLK